MPTYGKNKVKDIVRLALAGSGNRTSKALAHRTARHNMKQDVAEIVKDLDLFDEYLDDDKKLDAEIHGMRYDRGRGYRSLKRWAEETTSGEPDARVAQLRAKLPASEAGEKALKMVRWFDTFRHAHELSIKRSYYGYRPAHYETYKSRKTFLVELMSFRPWLHGKLNDALKKSHETKRHVPTASSRYINFDKIDPATGSPGLPEIRTIWLPSVTVGAKHARTLKGLSDIEDFLEDLSCGITWEGEMPMVTPQYGRKAKPYPAFHGKKDVHPEWTSALDAFMSKYPKGGDEP